MLLGLPAKGGSFWYSYSVKKGIIGCNSLIPVSRQKNKIKAVFSFSVSEPIVKTGLVAYTYTSQS